MLNLVLASAALIKARVFSVPITDQPPSRTWTWNPNSCGLELQLSPIPPTVLITFHSQLDHEWARFLQRDSVLIWFGSEHRGCAGWPCVNKINMAQREEGPVDEFGVIPDRRTFSSHDFYGSCWCNKAPPRKTSWEDCVGEGSCTGAGSLTDSAKSLTVLGKQVGALEEITKGVTRNR